MAYLNLTIDSEMLKIKTKGDEIKDLKYETEKHLHEKTLKSLKIDNEYHRKKNKSLKKKKVLLFISEILIGSGSAKSTSTMSIIYPTNGMLLTSSTALLASIAVLITNEYILKKCIVLS